MDGAAALYFHIEVEWAPPPAPPERNHFSMDDSVSRGTLVLPITGAPERALPVAAALYRIKDEVIKLKAVEKC